MTLIGEVFQFANVLEIETQSFIPFVAFHFTDNYLGSR